MDRHRIYELIWRCKTAVLLEQMRSNFINGKSRQDLLSKNDVMNCFERRLAEIHQASIPGEPASLIGSRGLPRLSFPPDSKDLNTQGASVPSAKESDV